MLTHERSIEMDGRDLLCTLLNFYDQRNRWPSGSEVGSFATYYQCRDRKATFGWLESEGYLRIYNEGIYRYYEVTDAGRAVMALPERQEPEPDTVRVQEYPEDRREGAIFYTLHEYFRKHGWWPTGLKRASMRAFRGGTAIDAIDRMRERGDLVRIVVRTGKGNVRYLIDPVRSPEYKGKDGWVFYAPSQDS